MNTAEFEATMQASYLDDVHQATHTLDEELKALFAGVHTTNTQEFAHGLGLALARCVERAAGAISKAYVVACETFDVEIGTYCANAFRTAINKMISDLELDRARGIPYLIERAALDHKNRQVLREAYRAVTRKVVPSEEHRIKGLAAAKRHRQSQGSKTTPIAETTQSAVSAPVANPGTLPDRFVPASHHKRNTYIFFCDVVQFSQRSIQDQIAVITSLYTYLSRCKTVREVPPERLIFIPTGDGCAIAFLEGTDTLSPLRVAIELHGELRQHQSKFKVRCGIHAGDNYEVTDKEGKRNLIGANMNLAARIMDLANPDQILSSKAYYESFVNRNDEFQQFAQQLGTHTVKHGELVEVVNYSGSACGSSEPLHPSQAKPKVVMPTTLAAADANTKTISDSVIGFPVAASAKDGRLYIRINLQGARKLFGEGRIEALPHVEATVFPHVGYTQVRATEVDGIEDRFPSIGEWDPFYRIVLKLAGTEGLEVCKRVFENPNSMGVLVSGHIELEKNGKKCYVPVALLNLCLGGGILGEHQGPIVRPKG